MSWRSQGITGSNNIPLGNKRRFGGDDSAAPAEEDYVKLEPSARDTDPVHRRGRSVERGELSVSRARRPQLTRQAVESVKTEDGVKRRKKRNRWGDADENKAAGLMGLPTMIMANMTNEQLEAYTLHLRIEEISQKLRINDVVPADGDR